MKQAQRGDKKAFIKLFELCEEEIYRMAFIYVKNKQDALDIVQETAYRSFKCISNLKEPQYFKTWLIKIAINNSLELIRNRQGVGNWGNNKRYYYISSSASGQTSYIESAMYHWIYTSEDPGVSTPISFRRTYDQNSSVMDIYLGNFYDESTGYIAETEFYIYSNRVNQYYENWGWTNIKINNPVYGYYLTNFQKEGTISHEMGHVMGLDHNNSDQFSIMCQLQYNRLVKAPFPDDLNGINALY